MSPANKLKILLVGVDLPTRRVVRHHVEKQANWSIAAEVGTADEAVESAGTTNPEVIVLDHEAISHQTIPLIGNLLLKVPESKLLLLTSVCSEQDIRAAIRAGAAGLVTKAECEKRFTSAVKRAASGQRFLSGQIAKLVLRRFLDSAVGRPMPRPALSDLTPRELEIIRLISMGNGNKQVAAKLGIAVRTAEVHRSNAMRKLNLHNLAELVNFAASSGLIQFATTDSTSI
jgi:DNA-binding NarL/FixJ family response regulator